jgi:hypothetical protein
MIEFLIKFEEIKLTSMKKISLFLMAVAMVSLWSCGKYEEGPMFSLRSKTGRIAGTWVYDKILQNDVDVTSQSTANSTYEMTIERDGTYKTVYSYSVLGQSFNGEDTGTWEFGDNETISYTSDNGGGANSTTIIRLTSSEFWTRETDTSGDVTEVHMKKK